MFLRELPFGDIDLYGGRAREWNFLAIANANGTCEVEDFLDSMEGKLYDTSLDMLAFLDGMVFETEGPRRWINTKRSHESVANARIFEFRIGDLRVHWFYGQGRREVILAAAAIKKGQNTPKPLANELLALKSQYEEAVKTGSIQIVSAPPGE